LRYSADKQTYNRQTNATENPTPVIAIGVGNVPFQHKYGYIRDKRSVVESYPDPVNEGQQYIDLNPGRLFVQQPPKRERDREAHLNCYASWLQQWKTIIAPQD